MSTIKVTNIEHASTANGGIQLDNAGHVTVDGQQMPTAGALSHRNLILNGACRVNQRQTTPTVGSTNTFGPVDHFETRTNGGQWQGQLSQETVSVNNEFTSCLRVKTTTAETTVDGTDQIVVETHMEGQDIQHLFQSTSGAKSLTISFWVRSSQAGTYIVKLYRLDGGSGRQLNKTYTINAADTWEYKTFTFVGDTSGGAIPNTVNEGMRVSFQLAAGSDFTSGTQPTTWTGYSNAVWAAGHVENSFMTTVNATWDVTGIQLEVGEKATPFEHRSFGDELARCQRYFETSYPTGTSVGSVSNTAPTSYCVRTGLFRDWQDFKVTKRAIPTVKFYSSNSGTIDKLYDAQTSSDISIVADLHSVNGARVSANASSDGNLVRWNYTAEAEL